MNEHLKILIFKVIFECWKLIESFQRKLFYEKFRTYINDIFYFQVWWWNHIVMWFHVRLTQKNLNGLYPRSLPRCHCNALATLAQHIYDYSMQWMYLCKIDRKMVVLNWKGGKSDLIRGELLLLSKQEAAYIGIQYICQLQFTVEMLLATAKSGKTCRASGLNFFSI